MPLVAAILVSGALVACMSDQGYSYWVLNDSNNDLLLDVREQAHDTYLVPPHAYAGLFSGMGVPVQGWTISLVDEQCLPLQTWQVDVQHHLVYVDAGGSGALASDPPWSHGLRSANQVVLARRDPPCD
jgi:hypothetical protein